MKILKTTFWLLLLLVAIAYSSQFLWPKYEETIPEIDSTKLELVTTKEVTEGITQHSYAFKNGQATVMTIYKLDPTKVEFSLTHDPYEGDILAWMTSNKNALLISNGFYFHEDHEPSGVFIEGNEKIGHAKFDEDKSVFIQLRPDLQLIDTEITPISKITAVDGAQTFPWLIKDGQPNIKKDSEKSARRTFIGIDKEGNNYIGEVAHNNVSLFKLAKLLSTTGIDWRSVANLDGGPSTGIMTRQDGKISGTNSLTPIPNIIMITEK